MWSGFFSIKFFFRYLSTLSKAKIDQNVIAKRIKPVFEPTKEMLFLKSKVIIKLITAMLKIKSTDSNIKFRFLIFMKISLKSKKRWKSKINVRTSFNCQSLNSIELPIKAKILIIILRYGLTVSKHWADLCFGLYRQVNFKVSDIKPVDSWSPINRKAAIFTMIKACVS